MIDVLPLHTHPIRHQGYISGRQKFYAKLDKLVQDNLWDLLSRRQLPLEYLERYKDNLDWGLVILYHNNFSNKLLKKYFNYLNTKENIRFVISSKKADFRFFDRCNVEYIPDHYWSVIARQALLSIKFIKNNMNKLKLRLLLYNDQLSYIEDQIIELYSQYSELL